MSLMKEYFYNIKCDVCGCLCNEESWQASPEFLSYEAEESEWLRLGGKDYCPDCWEYDENGDIVTADGKLWNIETRKEVK